MDESQSALLAARGYRTRPAGTAPDGAGARKDAVVDDLIEFLRARLDEDAERARAAAARPDAASEEAWRVSGSHSDAGGTYWSVTAGVMGQEVVELVGGGMSGGGAHTEGMAEHIARHDPARVLAEVDAKRRLLDLHALVHRDVLWLDSEGGEATEEIAVCGHCVPRHSCFSDRGAVPQGGCATLRLLATPYADHPDYRNDWRP
ncbi:DUF6221 family protein [Streptomyces fradiae]|uniref:DUF6221 family protein n=1 Tax=Streptomyces fradiae TaxID=1906 RepID=UPI0036F8C2AA